MERSASPKKRKSTKKSKNKQNSYRLTSGDEK